MQTQDSNEISVRPARPDDAAAVARIYDHYVRETIVSFEEDPPPASEIATRLRSVVEAGLPWLIAPNVEELSELLGRNIPDSPA